MPDLAMRPMSVAGALLSAIEARVGGDLRGADVRLTGATVDSRAVAPGDLFCALPGDNVHGAAFAAQAASNGAAAILTDLAGEDLAVATGLPVLVSTHARRSAALAAAEIYGDPSRRMPVIGVTGTNGKTTTSFLVEGALRAAHATVGLLGTVEMRIGEEAEPSTRTTTEAPMLQGLLARMVEAGAGAAVMEASSQAIALERVTATRFAVVLFTNLSYEHLDFHHTMEEYFEEKARIFTPEFAERAVVLVDDEWGRLLVDEVTVPVETVATRPGSPWADWNAIDAQPTPTGGMRFVLVAPDRSRHDVEIGLPGLINVSNAAGAIVSAHAAGVPLADAIRGVETARPVPGRTEIVTVRDATTPMTVVDYAHTPDGIASVLEAMRLVTPGRIIIVFGCDGLRDDSKRPGLGSAAAAHADVVVVTDENPRTEPPDHIRARILEGVDAERPDRHDVLEIFPRVAAVEAAIRMAGPEDTVIATGKGHETTQEIDGVHHPYTDAGAFLAALEAVRGERA
ncbi:UDP-N-acetylmuramoyl-L-alanyl-D-glutamate--2,6-diaminopimelate ligase [Demequina sp. SYSU T00039]|uniref:UDP-N-acetylmuramyl-tripeptide synthetase n=1 Tax=Demequina lignilytica TaxID=3051663 RepID=A0AAW7M442_9MICO|nr:MULTISPECIES: UDP-N-acetylmuramoyl-L-alanyl-D-glutamate--2,6-diaminopimelate ligase [unclassified Demequina]MDN4477119.1 UDP-N-acetylmuramoyl-L-alanyl-D-glutamate--2,6-diaminopimelate ligase [Demequina sp. SYSU T00039-1]MDN4487292.1 UDP-N-acetylmuramoyl-L-alanyl-D-glutamate--2,6-diaminopimelate ligase [Demequina sp. SYSU T00039]MDN4491543.1 UDP-N-acetylmuramoyl-L-alanyl-D-glutamate--2,6-diaminopimelate ligase [Demequina sp. SYSU T00068]